VRLIALLAHSGVRRAHFVAIRSTPAPQSFESRRKLLKICRTDVAGSEGLSHTEQPFMRCALNADGCQPLLGKRDDVSKMEPAFPLSGILGSSFTACTRLDVVRRTKRITKSRKFGGGSRHMLLTDETSQTPRFERDFKEKS